MALQHVHSHCVVHRDVKTQNAFLTADGRGGEQRPTTGRDL